MNNSPVYSKSQKIIRKTFIEFLEKKGFHNISVTDIVNHSDVSRSVFYLYYVDKYALLNEIEDELMSGMEKLIENSPFTSAEDLFDALKGQKISLFNQYFEYIKSTEHLWKIFLSGKGNENFLLIMRDHFYNRFTNTIQKRKEIGLPELITKNDLYIAAWVYIGIIEYWVSNGMKESTEEMGHVLYNFWTRYLNNVIY